MFGVYHDFDYGLYYANIRENAALRVRAWQGRRNTTEHVIAEADPI
jgi:hypothetical protein